MELLNQIICPRCGHPFPAHAAFQDQIRQLLEKERDELRKKYLEEKHKLENEKSRIEQEKQQLREVLIRELEEKNQKNLDAFKQQLKQDSELQIKNFQKMLEEKQEEIRKYKQYELEMLQMQEKIKNMQDDFRLQMEKEKLSWKQQAEEEMQKKMQESFTMKIKEYELKLEQQNKLINELKQKSDQGSMQLQGEAMEVALEEILSRSFVQDRIAEVPKGIRGADCIQWIRNSQGRECGSIIYESKRTKTFSNDWIDKLKADQRAIHADVAVLVTEAFPKELQHFGFFQGIWICRFRDVIPLAFALRERIILVSEALKSHENKGEKMNMLYQYLTGTEFRQQLEAIVEGFVKLKEEITREKTFMETRWKERETQINKIFLNTAHVYGSIQGITGNTLGQIKYLDGGS